MSEIAVPEANRGKQGWVVLILGWIVFLLPIPLISTIVGGVLVFVAMLLAVVQLQKRNGGVGLLIATLIGSPLVYFLGVFVLAGVMS
jgi:putative effector of murein hydrolase LrgA (UPF0299 family)